MLDLVFVTEICLEEAAVIPRLVIPRLRADGADRGHDNESCLGNEFYNIGRSAWKSDCDTV